MSELRITNAGDGDFVLRVRCSACGAFVRADGLPIIMLYLSDNGRIAVSRGVMAPAPHRTHLATCRGTVQP